MTAAGGVLLLGFGAARQALAGRLFLLRLRPLSAESIEEARAIVRSGAAEAGLVCSQPPFDPSSPALAELRKEAPSGRLPLVVTGPRPSKAALDSFRRAGATLALFEPFADSELRFVLNRARHELLDESRSEVRVPTDLVGRAESATGEKPVSIYNLSVGGAFLETMRPTAAGGRIVLDLPLPSGTLHVQAKVVSTNVPGNLQRPNLPMGMGVQFIGVEPDELRALAAYVDERQRVYQL